MKNQKYFLVFTLTFLFISCSKSLKNRSASEYLSAYMKDNKNVAVFGKINIKQVLKKADYKHIPKVSVLLINEMKQYENAIDLNQNIHFALEGPFEKDGTPSNFLAFVKVKNMDSLSSKVASLGLMIQEDDDLRFAQNKDVSIGIKNDLAILISKKEKYEAKALLKEVFEKTEYDLSEGKKDQILKENKDIVFGINMKNLYASSNTDLAQLSPEKKREFEALVNDSYIKSSISFEKGQAIFESQNLFSTELMNRMFLKEDAKASIIDRLGKGNAHVGLSVNLDINKMESFLDDFAPDFKNKLIKANTQLQLLSSILGDKPLTNLLSGKLGMVMIGDMMRDGSFVPEANIYVGLGNKGKEVSQILKLLFSENKNTHDMKIDFNEKEITVSSGKTNENKLNIPSFANQFGKKGFTAFINFDGMDLESMDLGAGAKALYAIQNITIEVSNEGTKIIVRGKNPSINILKQTIDVYVKDIEQTLGS